MYKMKKILLVWSICLSMIFSFSNIKAYENETKDNANFTSQELKWIEELEEINPEFDEIEGELISISKTDYVFENNQLVETYAAIPSSDMSLYLTSFKQDSGGYDKYLMQTTATWKKLPKEKKEDVIALSWAGKFAMSSSKCKVYNANNELVPNRSRQVSAVNNAGVGYAVKLGPYNKWDVKKVILEAYVQKADSYGEGNYSAAYAHAKDTPTAINISFGTGGVGLGIDLNVDSDEACTTGIFYW